MKTPRSIAGLALATLLTACGGGHDGDAPRAGDRVPPGATASPEAFARYVGSLPADDRAEPLDLTGVEPPRSDTAEPIEVDG